ncbi:MAG TPA: TonB family protein [Candidatus Sulfotelmatobacter sp.]|nr:TonB family protein [Candidatus Sulfotelmatobacter sp.]
MGIQCFLFSSDSASADAIRQVLAELDVQAESCPEAVAAVDKIAKKPFQMVIIDWDQQPEAGLLLTAARDRKAGERPINLAIVSDDASVPKALQAGANSVLRRPFIPSQVKDTLKTARDLIQSRQAPASAPTNAPASASPLPSIPSREKGGEHTMRTGEFLQSAPLTPGASFETEGDVRPALDQPSPEPVNPLKDLEPVAASVVQTNPAPAPPSPATDGETRGLEWYLKARGVTRQAAAAQPARAPAPDKPELLGYDQTSSRSASSSNAEKDASRGKDSSREDTRKEAALFAYIEGEQSESEGSSRGFRLGRKAIFAAFILASVAVAAAPQAPWHPQMRGLWARGQRTIHGWLNPQLVVTKQAPTTHEDFGQAGDEYKLPVAETIPDATTDPSQIKVLPVIDPTAKKTNTDSTTADQTAVQPDGSAAAPVDQGTANPSPGTVGQQVPTVVPTGQPAVPATAMVPSNSQPAPVLSAPATTMTVPIPAPAPTSAKPTASIPKPAPVQYTPPGNIPSSLKTQMAPNTPDPVAPKLPGGPATAIEPVAVGENAERALISDQPIIPYPATAKGQQGTVTLQVLIGRDGTVQDAKFLQGSLAFADAAITGVRQWKFKPYVFNGRPVSVQTLLTMTFTPPAH